MKRILIITFLLGGCGSSGEGSHNNHGYGYGYDAKTESDVRIRYGGYYSIDEATPEWFEETYRAVEACTGIKAQGPLVVFVDPPLYNKNGARVSGITYFDTGLIVTVTRSVVEHEFIHYLLLMNGFPDDLNQRHESPLFALCS